MRTIEKILLWLELIVTGVRSAALRYQELMPADDERDDSPDENDQEDEPS